MAPDKTIEGGVTVVWGHPSHASEGGFLPSRRAAQEAQRDAYLLTKPATPGGTPVVADPQAPAGTSVFRPAHYARFPIEPMTFAAVNNLSMLEGNVVKYTLRAPHKGKTIEDYQKAIRCLEMLIEIEKRKAAGTLNDVVGNPL